MITSDSPPVSARPPFWRDVRVLAWVFQIAILGLVVGLLAWLFNNVRTNSRELGIPTGFDFLDQPSNFTIPGNPLRATQPVRSAIYQGALNTIRVAVAGVVLSTVFGVLIGIGRLSGNFLVRSAARLYVEAIRNVPLLALLVFSYLALVLTALPAPDESWNPLGLAVVNVRGVSVPWIDRKGWLFLAIVAGSALVAWGVARWRQSVADRSGSPARPGMWAVPVFVVLFVGLCSLFDIGVTTPEQDGRSVSGGMLMQPEYFALLVALVVYTSSHIAEIVRGSIQAVPRGQTEAATAVALSGYQRMRFIILPQAMRIALPPLGNQYLNLTKNSSLGFVISYFELTKVTSTTIGNGSPAVPAYLLLMGIYLVFSLVLSFIVNVVNRRLALVTR